MTPDLSQTARMRTRKRKDVALVPKAAATTWKRRSGMQQVTGIGKTIKDNAKTVEQTTATL